MTRKGQTLFVAVLILGLVAGLRSSPANATAGHPIFVAVKAGNLARADRSRAVAARRRCRKIIATPNKWGQDGGYPNLSEIITDRSMSAEKRLVKVRAILKRNPRMARAVRSSYDYRTLAVLHEAALAGQTAIVDLLIKYGARIEIRTGYRGWTPLHLAAMLGHKSTAALLIAKGAKANDDVCGTGTTPLGLALDYCFDRKKRQPKCDAVARLLMRRLGSWPEPTDASLTALDLYMLGGAAQEKGDYKSAVKYYARAIESGGLSTIRRLWAHVFRCQIYSNYLKQYRLAIAECTKALNEGSGWEVAYYYRGNVHLNQKQYQRAIEDYTRAIKKTYDQWVIPYNARGMAYFLLGHYENAVKDYRRAMQGIIQFGMNYAPYRNWAWLYATCPNKKYQNGKLAVELALKAVGLRRRPSTLDTLAAAYARQGKFGLAVTTIKRAIALLKTKKRYSKRSLTDYRLRLAAYRERKAWQVNPPRQATTPAAPKVRKKMTAGRRTVAPPAATKFDSISFFESVKHGELDRVKMWIKLNPGAVKLTTTNGRGMWTALHVAAWTGRTKIAAFLIKMGAKVDARIDAGDTPLHVAAAFENKPIVILLINKGAQVTAAGYLGQSVLHRAVWGGNLSIINLLIEKSAKVNRRDELGMTPLHVAAERGRKSVVLFLLQKGADTKARDKQGETALYDSIRDGNTGVAALLISKGAPINSRNKIRGDTPLHVAARTGAGEMAALLIKRGAKVNSKNNHGDTPLHVAAWRGHLSVVSLLIAKGAKINARNKDGETPLHDAARAGQKAVVKLLLRHGANVNAKDKRGRKALETGSVRIRSSRKKWKRASRSQRAEARRIGKPVVFTNSIGMKFVLIPPGSFLMGSTIPGAWKGGPNYDDAPQHRVIFTRAFYMQTTEVTQAQWRSVMGTNPSRFTNCDNCPVENVSWRDAQEFIRRLNKREGGIKYRLPTEAEWEYACRAGTTTEFNTGQEITTKLANVDAHKTAPVGGYPPNAWGLYNMHGNVMEWCSDQYTRNYYLRSPKRDPEGPKTGHGKVARGSYWGIPAEMSGGSAMRSPLSPDSRGGDTGFRLVRMP